MQDVSSTHTSKLAAQHKIDKPRRQFPLSHPGRLLQQNPPASLDPKNRIIKDVSQGWLSTSETTSDDTGYVNILPSFFTTTTRTFIHSFTHSLTGANPPEGLSLHDTPLYPTSRPLFALNFSWRLALQGLSPIVSSTQPPLPPTTLPLPTNRKLAAGCVLNGKGLSPRLPPH